MAKRINSDDRKNNYQVERIRPAMSREKLDELYNSFKSDDDYVNFHLDNIDDTHRRYMIAILNDERKSPVIWRCFLYSYYSIRKQRVRIRREEDFRHGKSHYSSV